MHFSAIVSLSCTVILAATLPAQVPPGWGVYSTLNRGQGIGSNGSGLTMFPQYNGTGLSWCPTTAFIPVTGLPGPLAVPKTSRTVGGANCVLVRNSDGSLVAATGGYSGFAADIYHLTLNGSKVATTRKYALGTMNNKGVWPGVQQMAWLDDDNVLFCHCDITSTRVGWPRQGVAQLTLSTGAIRHISISYPAGIGTMNAMAYDSVRKQIHTAFYSPTAVYTVPLAGGKPTAFPTATQSAYQLDVDATGLIYMASTNAGLFTLNTANGAVTSLINIRQSNGMTIDRVSGEVQVGQAAVTIFPSYMFRYQPGSRGLFGVPGMHRLDLISGMAIRSCMIPMKKGSPSDTWKVDPNPGGAPLVGNQKFSLTLATTTAPLQTTLLLSTSMLATPIPVGRCNLWLGGTLFAAPMTLNTPRTEASTKLPIPVLPALCGVSSYAQSYSLGGAGLTCSRPMQVTFQ